MENLVTVFFFAYNHEKYIAKAIEGAIAQKTNFAFKVVVCDDCSQDDTAAVITDYIAKFPSLVEHRRTSKNHGLNWQFENAIRSIDTEFFTITGGDDYWMDPCKLQKQVDYLAAHQDVSIVLTGKRVLSEKSGWYVDEIGDWSWNVPQDRNERLMDLLLGRYNGDFPAMTTACCRSDFMKYGIETHPEIIRFPSPGEGVAIFAALSMYGEKMVCMPDITTVYLEREQSLSHFVDIEKELCFQYGHLAQKLFALDVYAVDKKNVYAKLLLSDLITYCATNKLLGKLNKIANEFGNVSSTHCKLYKELYRKAVFAEKCKDIKHFCSRIVRKIIRTII